jgi:hypothetical protein
MILVISDRMFMILVILNRIFEILDRILVICIVIV